MHHGSTDQADALARQYIAMWNETDRTRRRAISAEILSDDVVYLDPAMAGESHDGVTDMIGVAQQQFAGLSFQLRGQPETTGDCVRFSWTLGPAGGPSVVAGTDFARVHDGRFSSVTGFLDQRPGEPPPAG